MKEIEIEAKAFIEEEGYNRFFFIVRSDTEREIFLKGLKRTQSFN